MAKVDKDSLANTFIIAVFLCLVCSIVVSSLSVSLKPMQLLNKELEDRGVVEKITDESGLNVIGREAAAKLEEEKQATKEKKDE